MHSDEQLRYLDAVNKRDHASNASKIVVNGYGDAKIEALLDRALKATQHSEDLSKQWRAIISGDPTLLDLLEEEAGLPRFSTPRRLRERPTQSTAASRNSATRKLRDGITSRISVSPGAAGSLRGSAPSWTAIPASPFSLSNSSSRSSIGTGYASTKNPMPLPPPYPPPIMPPSFPYHVSLASKSASGGLSGKIKLRMTPASKEPFLRRGAKTAARILKRTINNGHDKVKRIIPLAAKSLHSPKHISGDSSRDVPETDFESEKIISDPIDVYSASHDVTLLVEDSSRVAPLISLSSDEVKVVSAVTEESPAVSSPPREAAKRARKPKQIRLYAKDIPPSPPSPLGDVAVQRARMSQILPPPPSPAVSRSSSIAGPSRSSVTSMNSAALAGLTVELEPTASIAKAASPVAEDEDLLMPVDFIASTRTSIVEEELPVELLSTVDGLADNSHEEAIKSLTSLEAVDSVIEASKEDHEPVSPMVADSASAATASLPASPSAVLSDDDASRTASPIPITDCMDMAPIPPPPPPSSGKTEISRSRLVISIPPPPAETAATTFTRAAVPPPPPPPTVDTASVPKRVTVPPTKVNRDIHGGGDYLEIFHSVSDSPVSHREGGGRPSDSPHSSPLSTRRKSRASSSDRIQMLQEKARRLSISRAAGEK